MSEFISMITTQIRPNDSTSKCMGSTSSAEWGLQMNSPNFSWQIILSELSNFDLWITSQCFSLTWKPPEMWCWNPTWWMWCWNPTWWLIPLSKWVITPVINGISRVNPLITGVITHLLSGMSHQVQTLVELEWQEGMRSSLKRPCWNYGTPCGAWQSPETTPTDPWKIQLFAGQLNTHKNSPCSNTIWPTQLFLKLPCATHVPRFCEIARRPKPSDATLPSGKSTCLTGKSSLTGPFVVVMYILCITNVYVMYNYVLLSEGRQKCPVTLQQCRESPAQQSNSTDDAPHPNSSAHIPACQAGHVLGIYHWVIGTIFCYSWYGLNRWSRQTSIYLGPKPSFNF